MALVDLDIGQSINVCARICDPANRELLRDPTAGTELCELLETMSLNRNGAVDLDRVIEQYPAMEAACSALLPMGGTSSRFGLNLINNAGGLNNADLICNIDDNIRPWVLIGGGLIILLWFATYILMAIQARKDKLWGLPILALTIMWGYEFCYSFLFESFSNNFALEFVEVAWLILDSILVYQVYRFYKPSLVAFPWVRAQGLLRYWPLLVTFMLAMGVGGNFVIIKYFEAGPTLAYLVNMILAALFLSFILARPKLEGISVPAMWTRVIADLMTMLVTLSAFPFQVSFTDLCERSANTLLSAFILITTVVIDMLAMHFLYTARRRNTAASAPAPQP